MALTGTALATYLTAAAAAGGLASTAYSLANQPKTPSVQATPNAPTTSDPSIRLAAQNSARAQTATYGRLATDQTSGTSLGTATTAKKTLLGG